MSLTDQRKLTREYIDQKVEEIKKNNRSNTELTERLFELIKFAKSGDVSLNIDTLTGSKQDPKIAGIIMHQILIIETIELFPDKILPEQIEKAYLSMHKNCGPKESDIS